MLINIEDMFPKAKANQFLKNKIQTNYDLAEYIPVRYDDFRYVYTAYEALDNCEKNNVNVAIAGKIKYKKMYSDRGFYRLDCEDRLGKMFSVFVFGYKRLFTYKEYLVDSVWLFFGKMKRPKNENFHPVFTPFKEQIYNEKALKIYPVYKKITKMSESYLEEAIDKVLEETIDENLDESIRKHFNLMDRDLALRIIHNPNLNPEEFNRAFYRYVFGKLYDLAKIMVDRKEDKFDHFTYPDIDSFSDFMYNVPFELTPDQIKTIYAIKNNMIDKSVNALIQGDVGSGKTVVALAIMSQAISNKTQAVLVAPTETLAKQHLQDALGFFGEGNVAFLAGSQKAKERKENLDKIKNNVPIIVGTHSLLQPTVEYNCVSMCLFDEQHKFGVEQRNMLSERMYEKKKPHYISLTATPIPRSLALSAYSDLVSIYDIKTKPAGRKEIKTLISESNDKSNKIMYSEIIKGHQVYVVCPFIEDSEAQALSHVQSVESTYESLVNDFKRIDPKVKIDMISGSMKQSEINEKIQEFKDKKSDILISTTIIEVGVNVPNATVMLIKSSDRMGLATLHQLRGRVGRSSLQSYCVLQPDNPKDRKSEVLCSTTDGFKISELDMEHRGSGSFLGTDQSGLNGDLTFMLKYNKTYHMILDYLRMPF